MDLTVEIAHCGPSTAANEMAGSCSPLAKIHLAAGDGAGSPSSTRKRRTLRKIDLNSPPSSNPLNQQRLQNHNECMGSAVQQKSSRDTATVENDGGEDEVKRRKLFRRSYSTISDLFRQNMRRTNNERRIEPIRNQVQLKSIKEHLLTQEQHVQQLFPFSKSGNGRDDYSYFRVQHDLMELKKELILWLGSSFVGDYYADNQDIFNRIDGNNLNYKEKSANEMKLLLEFMEFASSMALRLPEFDNRPLNAYKSDLYHIISFIYQEILATHWWLSVAADDLKQNCLAHLRRLAAENSENFDIFP